MRLPYAGICFQGGVPGLEGCLPGLGGEPAWSGGAPAWSGGVSGQVLAPLWTE